MAIKKLAGKSGALKTSTSFSNSDKNSATVIVEGPYSAVKSAQGSIGNYVPGGYTALRDTLTPEGNGLAKLVIECNKFDSGGGSDVAPIRTSFEVEMCEVQYDLEDHPHLASGRDLILKWLATDESKRVDGDDFKYTDKNGDLQTLGDEVALKFCNAYMAGIKTFNRYYPVITKISVWKNPPGLNRFGQSFSGGSPRFSYIGTFDTPPISLSGYPQTKYFKSKDAWRQNENRTWARTEQWTFTPEGSTSQHAWIYNEL